MERSIIEKVGISVLYIDDEPDLIELAKAFLRSYPDLRIETAISAKAALAKLGKEHDIIVSDYQMAGMNGLELLVTLRKDGNDIPFILFTGRGREEVAIEALNNGADYYIQKGGEPKALFAELHHKIKLAVERRRAASKLRDSESRFRGIIENAHAGYFLMGEDGRLIDVNHSWLRMHGYDLRKEVAGRELWEFLAPDEKEKGRKIMETLLQGECFNPVDLQYQRKDGSVGTCTLTASPVIEGLGFVGVEGFCFDVSDLRSMVQELDSSRKRHDELYRSMDEGVAIHEVVYQNGRPADYLIVDVNPSFERILGIRREDAVGRLATVVYGTLKAPFLEQYASVADSGIPMRMETYFAPLDKYFEISVTSSEKGKFATIFIDVSKTRVMTEEIKAQSDEIQTQNEQLQAQREELMETYDKVVRSNQQLRTSEEKWKSIIDATSDGVIDYDIEQGRVTVNPRARSLFGYAAGSMSLTFDEMMAIINPEDRPKVEQRLKKYFYGETEIFQSEHRILGQDGVYHWNLVRMKIIDRDEKGKALRMLGTRAGHQRQQERRGRSAHRQPQAQPAEHHHQARPAQSAHGAAGERGPAQGHAEGRGPGGEPQAHGTDPEEHRASHRVHQDLRSSGQREAPLA